MAFGLPLAETKKKLKLKKISVFTKMKPFCLQGEKMVAEKLQEFPILCNEKVESCKEIHVVRSSREKVTETQILL